MGRMETAELSEELPDCFRTWRPPFTFPPALYEGSSFSTSSPTPVIVLKKKKKKSGYAYYLAFTRAKLESQRG